MRLRFAWIFSFLMSLISGAVEPADAGCLGDRVWMDADSDGIQDPGEPGLARVAIRLEARLAGGTLALAAVTDAAGQYVFTGLPGGEYTLLVDPGSLPAGALQTGDPDHYGVTLPPGAGDHQAVIWLDESGCFTNADFGYWAPRRESQLGQRIYYDADGSGSFNIGEPGLAAVTVTLLESGLAIAETATDAEGRYLFTGLAAGTYEVWISDRNGDLDLLEPRQEWDGSPDGRCPAVVDGVYPVLYLDFGYAAAPGIGRISGQLWMADSGLPMAAHPVFLMSEDGLARLAETATAPDGRYEFTGLAPGRYWVQAAAETQPDLPRGYFIRFEHARRIDIGNRSPVQLAFPELQRTDLDFSYETPLLAVIGSVEATESGGQTRVRWETVKSWNTVGFWLERQTDAGWSRVNGELIPAPLFGSDPVVYEQPDPDARAGGTYRYRLVEFEAGGTLQKYGPYDVTVNGPGRTYETWTAAMFSSAEQADPATAGRGADPDGDGLSNWQEFLAWTDPARADSRLGITAMRRVDDTVELTCATVPGRRYRLAVADAPGGIYLPLDPPVLATGASTILGGPADLERAFWQVLPTGE